MSQPPSYFARFPHFIPDPSASVEKDFTRLADHQHWRPKSKKYNAERQKCLLAEYDHHLGHFDGSSKLAAWQDLCREVGLQRPPPSTTQCKKVLHSLHINLVDLIDSRRNGTKVRRFGNAEELQLYTVSQNKVFPKNKAKQEGLIKIFLRPIF